ncbi:hypothetical protein EPUS_08174 [Endocarpon pusillum Z07020]|uniref:Glutamine amidotransferase domain-containing protein n=1 Tax=Endocarpon pusillum (strain Z07020 / HMAS-L-300199) TaxID=1263415 RepID=U1HFP3_ENDPU|nr:uncharacterized protein EPUS_08174 [Endocarpon pusillum Z07020]ERF68940.1 hypothetical protein EPUS_08174 [Endocarpon pusillum Z07020]
MRPPLRLAILECDSPPPNADAKYGGYGGVFTTLLRYGAELLGKPDLEAMLQISKYQIQLDPDNYPKLEDVDAILLTGSRYNSFEDAPWIKKLVDFTAEILKQDRIRLIGVCFGHQIIGRAMGVKVGRNEAGWEAAVDDFDLSERGKQLFGKEKLSIHQMHRDIIYYYPDGVEQLGSSPVCAVQGMYKKGHLITVQGHPEFNEEIMTELLRVRHTMGIFNDDEFDKYMDKAGKPHDGVVVARAFLEFLLDD